MPVFDPLEKNALRLLNRLQLRLRLETQPLPERFGDDDNPPALSILIPIPFTMPYAIKFLYAGWARKPSIDIQADLEQKFQQMMSGVTLIGHSASLRTKAFPVKRNT